MRFGVTGHRILPPSIVDRARAHWRRVLPTGPVSVEYHLTPRGLELAPVLDALTAWSHRWIDPPDDAVDTRAG